MSDTGEVSQTDVHHSSVMGKRLKRIRPEFGMLSIAMIVILGSGGSFATFASFARGLDLMVLFTLAAGLFWAIVFVTVLALPILSCLLLLFRRPVLAIGGFIIMAVSKPFFAYLWVVMMA